MLLNPKTILLLASTVSAEVYKLDLGGSSLKKRSFNESYKLTGLSSIFEGTIELGTPGQEIEAIFDTGSYTLGVMWSDNQYCEDNTCSKGAYDPSISSSSQNTSQSFGGYGFADGSSGDGYYFNDTLSIAGLELHDYKFGLLQNSNGELNTLGLGLDLDHRDAPILTNHLVNNKITERRIFSSYYSEKTDKAVLIFGGLDKARYFGQLQKIPSSAKYEYDIFVGGLSTECGTLNSNGYVFNLDTGGAFGAGFPSVIYHRLNQLYGGFIVKSSLIVGGDETDEFYAFKCQNAKPLIVDFQGKKVTWSARSQILPITSNGEDFLDEDGDQLCTNNYMDLGDADQYVFGSYFLKDVFVVWDGDSGEIAIAQGKYSDDEELVEITGDIPDAVNALDYYRQDYNQNDTLYNQPSTSTLSGTSLTATGTYSGSFASGSCSATSVSSSSLSASTDSSASSALSESTDLSSSSASSAYSTSTDSGASSSSSTDSSARLITPSSSEVSSFSSSIYPTTQIEKQATKLDSSSPLNSSQTASYSSSHLSSAFTTSVSSADEKSESFASTAIESQNHTILETITSCSDNHCSQIVTTIEPSTTKSTTSSSNSPTDSTSSIEAAADSLSAETSVTASSPPSNSNISSNTVQESETYKETSSNPSTVTSNAETSSSAETAEPSLAPKYSSKPIESSTSTSSTSSTSLAAAISTYEGSSTALSIPFMFKLVSSIW